jgi:hypothetical protein
MNGEFGKMYEIHVGEWHEMPQIHIFSDEKSRYLFE